MPNSGAERGVRVTYCAGWKYKNSVCLLANAGAVNYVAPVRRMAGDGESPDDVEGGHVAASPLRLVALAPGVAVAYAGDADLAEQLLDFLREQHSPAASPRELLTRLTIELGPFDAGREVALLLASSSPEGEAELLHWTTSDGLDASTSDFHQIGAPTPHHAALTPELRGALAAGDMTTDRLLPILTAVVQAHGEHVVAKGLQVGELIFGLRTEQGAIAWQDDTHVVLYEPEFAFSTHVSVRARDNAIAAHSAFTNEVSVFAPAARAPAHAQRLDAWRRAVHAARDPDRFRHWVFISAGEKVVTLVIRNELERESRFVRVAGINQGKFDLSLSPELTALLLRPLHNRDQGPVPLHLSVRED